jgi:hypothetical protein
MTTARVRASTAVDGARHFIGSKAFMGARTNDDGSSLHRGLSRASCNCGGLVLGTARAAVAGEQAAS